MICGDRLSHFIAGVDAVGIFRKSGGKQRINHLKEMIEGDPGNSVSAWHYHFLWQNVRSMGGSPQTRQSSEFRN